MNFEHTEDRRMLSDTLRRFIAEQYPYATRDGLARSARGYSPEFWRRYAELGAVAALFSEADGGLGGAGFDIAVVFEELGRGLVLEPFLDALVVGSLLADAGTPAQKELLAGLMEGSLHAALALAEPESGYDPAGIALRAEPDGDGWVLDGEKSLVYLGAHADRYLVAARSQGRPGDETGISLFLAPAHAPGLTAHGHALIDGGRAAQLRFDRVRLAADALVGRTGQGYPALERALGRGLLALCAEAVGAMDCARDATLDYLRTRRQFGVPIGSFQALQHRMADLLLEIEQARSAVINAAAALDNPDRAVRERALSAAKATIGRVGTLVAEESIQMHGGIGMTWELPLAHYAKRLVMIDHQFGDEDHHLRRYIALGRP